MTRHSFDELAFQLTRDIAQRSTCPRLHTAAVIMTPDHRLVASGYNGSLPELEHCANPQAPMIECWHCNGFVPDRYCLYCDGRGFLHAECLMIDGHCVRTVHAEANAIAQAAKYGPSIKGCHIYVLHQSCLTCTKLIVASGIVAIHYDQPYTVHTEEQKIADRLLIDSNVKIYNTV